jgi:SAM-dependent methyltransferase
MTVVDGERERRMVFGEVADVYERVRPGYPAELVQDVLAYGPVCRGDRVLEVGAGTGKATRLFAAHGLRMVCLEPSASMAAVARHHCAGFPDVCFEVATFEDWPLEAGAFRLVVSAQAWHWVLPEVRCPKAHAALAPGGALALFWNRPQVGNGELRAGFDEIYDRLAPALRAGASGTSPGLAQADEELPELERCGLFVSVAERRYVWSEEYSGARYLDLLQTQSDHRLLEEHVRYRLLDALGGVIADAGGAVTLDYETRLYLALRS